MSDKNLLQTQIREWLDANRMSERELSLRAGLNEKGVSQILSGRSQSPRGATLRALADAMGKSVNELLGSAEEEGHGRSPRIPARRMGERVRRLREIRGKSIVDLALAVGLPPEELQRIEIGERKPSDREIHELAAVLHVNRSAILFGRSDPGTSIADGDVVGGPVAETGTQTNQLVPAAGPSIEHHGQAYVSLPIYDATVLADAGLLDNDGAKPEAWTLFGVDQLRTLTRAEPNQLAIVKVSGDSMAPTLQHGDLVLIDRSIRQIGRDGLYVITSGYEVQVKRITRDWKTKTLTISSDNPAYASSTGVEEGSVIVLGRLIWISRSIGG